MLQHGAARESKLAEISRIHGAILGVTVPLIDAVYFDLIMQSETIAQICRSDFAERLDSGLSAVMALLRRVAAVKLMVGRLRAAAGTGEVRGGKGGCCTCR